MECRKGYYDGAWKTDVPGTSIYSKAFIDVDDFQAMGILAQQVMRDGRPADVAAPEPNPCAFTAFFGDQPIMIQGTFSYAFNHSDDLHAGEESLADCLRTMSEFDATGERLER